MEQDIAPAIEYIPGVQAPEAPESPVVSQKLPAGQLEQLVVPVSGWNVPAGQLTQSTTPTAENWPELQGPEINVRVTLSTKTLLSSTELVYV